MTTNPFKNKPKEKIEHMARAANRVQDAIKALEAAGKCSEHWAEYASIMEFKKQLETFMSCDQGEAGLEPYILGKHI